MRVITFVMHEGINNVKKEKYTFDKGLISRLR